MSASEIHSLLLPVNGIDVLLPNATVAEMIGYSAPEVIEGAVEWVLGTILWQGWQVPVIDYAGLIEAGDGGPLNAKRICVVKTLTRTERMPYMALAATAKPRLVTIAPDSLEELHAEYNPIAVLGHVRLDEHEAIIPDLDRLGHLVAHAAFGALPLTS